MKKITVALGLLFMAGTPEAQAVNQEIRALFQPDPAQPSKNQFVNQTPNSGYCAIYAPQCAQSNMFSIELPVRFTSELDLAPGHGVSLQVPVNWRPLTVTNRDTGETEVVEVSITGVGSTFHLSKTVQELTGIENMFQAHDRLWTANGWVYAAPPCRNSPLSGVSPTTYRFFWLTPAESTCTKIIALPIPSMWFEKLDFSYALKTPNPLGMSSGLYTGSISYSMGPGGDFHMGHQMHPDDSNLTLDFVLDVQHTLKVEIPPGGNHVVLEPQGGWRTWLENGRKPVRLYRDQLFHISASSKFSMRLECEHDLGVGSGCAILDQETGFAGAVDVSVSLPNGLTTGAGQPVKRYPLGIKATSAFEPGFYVDRKPGTLHFEVDKNWIDWLIDKAKGRPYTGNITVIWDSEVS
ncbi:hypothetical protein JRG42_09590 [Pseudomonas granadensis]|uniref:hypothetical protein n=1 Tax=Pseudomonas granadensis TaxID=1421430 RepID=UPI0019D10869|nr:hypothetical protein [Pseudomonas granadensis]MBN6773871.1 hypothetical protein [Pseudomonas granadensis]MBN6804270.1 hypothetical protein [Pseudomonas granadensis]MBN6831416.1 hypothetical protein [Pseudomonas granadensis]MBN6838945.1 hypothetical protein [Pseudomonas granadensis]MBN6868439.1 hypothetical protein [Pseudomonas granadensis]